MKDKAKKIELLKLEPNLVLLFSAIAIPVVILGSLLILGSVRAEMNRFVGEDFLGGTAEDTARHLDSQLLNTLTTVHLLAATPALHEAVRSSNRRYSEDPVDIERRLREVDQRWIEVRGAVPLALEIVGADVSDYLREIASIRPSYREILLTDRFGALVAATNITTDYYQADEDWWRRAFGDGDTGSLYFGELELDRSAGGYTLQIAVPVREKLDAQTTEVTGILKVLVGAEELFSVVGSVRRGQSGRALLIDSGNGTVVAGSDPGDVMRRQYPAFAQLKERLQGDDRSFIGRQGDEVRLAAFSGMPQPSLAPFGHWVVVVEQLYDEVSAPIRRATGYLVAFLIGVVLLVLVFSLYLHYKLVKPIREIDLREEMDRLAPEPN